ncbi:MAG: hypothetical protein O7B26_13200 [Planctomycetota bacterium]|nr:hypothetical protein [Planctomycetota bacterium]
MTTLRATLTALALFAFVTPAIGGEECTCKDIKKTGAGWCSECKGGAMYGVKLTSAKLYEALQGKKVKDVEKMKCAGCKTAATKGGTCKHCKVAFHDGKSFHSPVSATLAKGKKVEPDKIKCKGCKSASTKGGGFCTGCDAGIVKGLSFKGKDDFKAAKNAMTTLTKAAKTVSDCEACAVAMVTDGKCAACKVQFKDGKAA